MPMTTVWLALGSNLGDRDAALALALRGLEEREGIVVVECSTVYETDAVGPGEQLPYLNAVVRIETELSPELLLDCVQQIEQRAGREPAAGRARWAARTLDIDILFFGDTRIELPGLVVPHPRIAERSFVLVPLAAIAPDLVHPGHARTVAALLDQLLEAPPGEAEGSLPPGIRPWERCRRIADASSSPRS